MVTASPLSVATLSTQPNWEYVAVETLTPIPNKFGYMNNYNVIIDKPTIIVSIGCKQAKRTWKFAGYAYQKLLFTPSINSAFGSRVITERKYLKLGEQNLLQFPDYGDNLYQLTIEFPQWLREIDLEIWKYIG